MISIKDKLKVEALNRVINTLNLISSRVKLHPVDEVPLVTESILTCRKLIGELELPNIAYPLDPIHHNVSEKIVKYHRISLIDNPKGDRAHCNTQIHLDTGSGIVATGLLKSELCKRCFNAEPVDYSPTGGFMVTGFKNPALAALACLRVLGVEFNEKSFLNIAYKLDNVSIDPGILVTGFHDLYRICDLGNFTLSVNDGVFYAEAN